MIYLSNDLYTSVFFFDNNIAVTIPPIKATDPETIAIIVPFDIPDFTK